MSLVESVDGLQDLATSPLLLLHVVGLGPPAHPPEHADRRLGPVRRLDPPGAVHGPRPRRRGRAAPGPRLGGLRHPRLPAHRAPVRQRPRAALRHPRRAPRGPPHGHRPRRRLALRPPVRARVPRRGPPRPRIAANQGHGPDELGLPALGRPPARSWWAGCPDARALRRPACPHPLRQLRGWRRPAGRPTAAHPAPRAARLDRPGARVRRLLRGLAGRPPGRPGGHPLSGPLGSHPHVPAGPSRGADLRALARGLRSLRATSVGARLPTADEWEKAVRGLDGRRWPWGDHWRPGRVVTAEVGLERPLPIRAFGCHGDSLLYSAVGGSSRPPRAPGATGRTAGGS
ncbi:MAG: SUMF1/EgtB/PvdO family nonheme iron enzyme [Alphaproteobacteria bacterium]|nr:SUMF1/EgtB/PvdO family nonheme iron enzyme [Alphaproteobacteria bacterium]